MKENVYVEAVQALGASRRRVVLQHIVPNVVAPYIIMLTAQLGGAILAEAALSLPGAGRGGADAVVGPDALGLRAVLRREGARGSPLFPGIAISLGVFGFNLFGDSLRDALDPRSCAGRVEAVRSRSELGACPRPPIPIPQPRRLAKGPKIA